MLVSSIIKEIKEVTGLCEDDKNFQAISRAIELLSNEGLFDPLIGCLEFSTSQSNLVVLPRDVKTILRLNINSNPTFHRNRLFEYTLGTNGSDDGEEIGFSWSDRNYLAIHDETKLPGKLCYRSESPADNGKNLTVYGKDVDGKEIKESFIASDSEAEDFGSLDFYQITKVSRDTTTDICLLYCGSVGPNQIIAQYYPSETVPNYRVIKLSKKVSAVRMLFRRDVFEITSLADIIPLHSRMAVIHAAKAVRFYAAGQYAEGQAAYAMAVDFLKKEQASRDEGEAMAAALESPTLTDTTINVRDGIVAADVYDTACEIFGFIGRAKVLDRITSAVEALANKAHWDSAIGVVDIWMTDRSELSTVEGKGSGYFVLPRFVEAVISLNLCGSPSLPRNRWFEFHMNGTGETSRASAGAWDDQGEVCVISRLPIHPETKKTVPVVLVAIPNSEADSGKEIKVFGYERLFDGSEVEVWRNGKPGYVVPCVFDSIEVEADAPRWVQIDRITRQATTDYVTLRGYTGYSTTDNTEVVANDSGSLELTNVVWEGVSQSTYIRIAITSTLNEGQQVIVVNVFDAEENSIATIRRIAEAGADSVRLAFPIDNQTLHAVITGVAGLDNGLSYTMDISRTYNPSVSLVPQYLTLGFWYPDEVEPKYRAIKASSAKNNRIRILYRKRTPKISSLFEPIPLRSRRAIELMMRALKIESTDPAAAMTFEQMATNCLREERINSTPSDAGSLQFDEGTMPGVTHGIT